MPGLYPVIFAFIFLSYWVDKILLLRYYRITKGYSHHMAEYVAATLPWAVVIHCAAGIMFFGCPTILNTDSTPGYGNNTQYFNPKRLGQRHMVIFVALSIFVTVLVVFEKLIVGLILFARRAFQRCCLGCLRKSRQSVDRYQHTAAEMNGTAMPTPTAQPKAAAELWGEIPSVVEKKSRNPTLLDVEDPEFSTKHAGRDLAKGSPMDFASGLRLQSPGATPEAATPMADWGDVLYSDDLFAECSFNQLFAEFIRMKKERQTYKLLKSKGSFSQTEERKYVASYIQILERNERSLGRRLQQLTDAHIDRIDDIEPELMTAEQKMKTVLEYYNQAIDKDNPQRA